MARPKAALVVTKVDRRVLDSMAHRARTAPQLARRARIVLACATGLDNTTVAKTLRMSKPTVGRWRQRFIDKGGDGLLDEPRPGAPRTINDTQVDAVVTRTLETTPRGATHWSTRTLAKATGVSPMSVHRIWQAFGLQPHRTKTFTLSPDPLLIDTVRDIVGLYLNPPQHAAVFCVDEKPQIQAWDRTAPVLPLRPGQAERRTHDDKRHGTTSRFAALEVKTGHVLGQIRRRHRAIEFRAFLTALDVQVLADLDVHVIMDNDGTHKTALIRRWFARHPRFHPHFTPTYASWLHLVERWFAALEMKQLRRGVHDSVRSLESAIREFIDASNTAGQPYVWTKTADDILASIARFALRTVTVHDRQQVMSRTTGAGHQGHTS